MEIKKILENTSNFLIKRFIEVLGLFISILSVLLLIALLSYAPEDPNFIFPDNTEIKNILGSRGSFVSDLLFQSIGLISILIMFGYLFFNNNDYSFIDNLRISSFNVLSILSGTGYVTDDFGLWGKFPLIFFLFLMFVGGCAGSTTCGIKIFRFQILFLFIRNQIKPSDHVPVECVIN